MLAGARPLAIAAIAMALLVAACAASPAATAPTAAPTTAAGSPSAAPSATEPDPTSAPPAEVPDGGPFGTVPLACFGLGETDCRAVAGHVAAAMPAADPRVRYVQVGPFGCAAGESCPTTLAARPEGDVVVETATGTLSFHVTGSGAAIDVQPQESFGVDVAPSSRPPLAPVPQPLTLGHCGLWSGIDVAGSWWDPVGLIDSDHSDAINAAEGTFAPIGLDRATFTSKGGLVVQLIRRDGEKHLPLCM